MVAYEWCGGRRCGGVAGGNGVAGGGVVGGNGAGCRERERRLKRVVKAVGKAIVLGGSVEIESDGGSVEETVGVVTN